MAGKKTEVMERSELEEMIVARAWKDEGFRKAFLADPKKQFEERLGTKLPPNLKIVAFEEDASHLHFVIPMKPAPVGELSDADLEKVAGGVDAVAYTVAIAVTAIATAINEGNRVSGKEYWGKQ